MCNLKKKTVGGGITQNSNTRIHIHIQNQNLFKKFQNIFFSALQRSKNFFPKSEPTCKQQKYGIRSS